jgi:hypothetical protein
MIAAVNRQNRGIVEIQSGVADSSRIRCHRRGAGGRSITVRKPFCSRSSWIEAAHSAFPKVFATKKTDRSAQKSAFTCRQHGSIQELVQHFVRCAGAVNSNGAKFMASQSSGQKKTVGRVMHEFKQGELKAGRGRRGKVKNPKQAIAIALHEAGASNQESPQKNKRNLARTKSRERTGKTAAASASKTSQRKTSGRKTSGRKASGRKSTTRKSTARKSTARKSTAGKSTAPKSTARKSTAPKPSTRKSTTRNTATKRRSPSRSTARPTRRKSTARSATPRGSKSAARGPRK